MKMKMKKTHTQLKPKLPGELVQKTLHYISEPFPISSSNKTKKYTKYVKKAAKMFEMNENT